MNHNRLIRFIVASALAIPAVFLSIGAGQASEPAQDTGTTGTAQSTGTTATTECVECHDLVQSHWVESDHGTSFTSQTFQEQWNAEGQPRACLECHTTGFDPATGLWQVSSVSCTTCHNPVPGNHPDQIMPTDMSSELCGTCHLDTHDEWATSTHGQEDLACVNCHSPHTTEIRAGDTQELCSACHAEEVHFYTYTAHYEEGLLCIDCHVRVTDQPLGGGHGRREHSFMVDMATCSRCHSDEMHFPVPADTDGSPMGGVTTNGETIPSTLQSTPEPANPLGFALIATLVGTGLGMILAPWTERWFHKNNS